MELLLVAIAPSAPKGGTPRSRSPMTAGRPLGPAWRTVEQFVSDVLRGAGGSARGALVDLDRRIAAHGQLHGVCANGCNVAGFCEPFPCQCRTFYDTARRHLLSVVDVGGVVVPDG
jgi:hypothetical protein